MIEPPPMIISALPSDDRPCPILVWQVTDLLREGAPIGAADDGADNSFHAHRWVLEGRADVAFDSFEGALGLIARGDACKRKARCQCFEPPLWK